MNDCIFCKIANKQIPKEFTYEDEDLMVFPDIHPLKPIHLLIVTKKHIPDLSELEDNSVWIKVKDIIQKLVKDNDLAGEKGYRIVINGGGAKFVNHFHVHLLGPIGKTAKI